METKAEFKLEEWDDCSETSMFHFSYIIKTLFPVRWVGWKNGPAFKSYQKFLLDTPEDDIVKYIPTGSQAEGIGIPEAIRRGSSFVKPEIFSDFDVLCVIKSMKFSTKKLEQSSEEFQGYLDYDHTRPGYVRICMLTMHKNPNMVRYDSDTGMNCYSSSNVSNDMFSQLLKLPDKDTHQQGPAMTITDHGKQLLNESVEVKPFNEVEMDIVPAFTCTPWPKCALSWETRAKQSEWLHADLVASIITDGCHVVGVPSRTSQKPDIEWRLSFSASEGRLAREAMTDHQRQCYIYLKILRYQAIKEQAPALSSYVFKSIFLHCCEKLPVAYWKDYPGNCVLYMIDVLLERLHSKHVPTYFLPENNLIGHLTVSKLQTAIMVVQKVRSDPINPILDFMDHRLMLLHPLFGTGRMMMQPVLEDMKQFKIHRDKKLSIQNGISQSSMIICSLYLRETDGPAISAQYKHREAVKCLVDLYTNYLHDVYPSNSLLSFINTVGLSTKPLERSVRFFTAVVSLCDDYPEFSECRGNLACMLHAYAYNKEGEINAACLKQADELFQQVYNEDKSCIVDYATFLLKQNRFQETEVILDNVLENCSFLFKNVFSYSAKEMKTVDDSMRLHIEDNGSVIGDTLLFVYYYKVKCLCDLDVIDKSLKITQTLDKLQHHQDSQSAKPSFDFYAQAKMFASTFI